VRVRVLFHSSAAPRPLFLSFVSLIAAVAYFIRQLDRGPCFFHSSVCLWPGARPFFHSFVSFTAIAAAAVVSFIRQLDGQERAAEGGTWQME
jgi:hypothetical protein